MTVFEGSDLKVVSVRFKNPDDAERCVAMMNNRAFGDTMLNCELYDGVTDFRASSTEVVSDLMLESPRDSTSIAEQVRP